MNGAIRNNSTGRVLSFEQKGDFFYKRGNDKLDKNDLIEALCSYRRAMEQEPEDQYSRIAVAEVLSEMERYDDSNRVLLPLLSREDVEPEAIFGLGCNLAALNETDSAKKMLERYLQAEPEGEYIYDAYDLLDAIDDAEYRPGDFGELAPVLKEDMALDAAEECKGRPTLIIANTVKGYGSLIMENKASWHHHVPTEEEYRQISESFRRKLEEAEHE